MTRRERVYRRLMLLYPSAFRREYGDEMLGVLMSDPRARPGQLADLVTAALIVRLRGTLADERWRQAAMAVQVFGAILLCSLAVRRLPTRSLILCRHQLGMLPPVSTVDVIRLVAWAAVLVAALAGLRRLGVVAAMAGLGGEIAAPARSYLDTPAVVLYAFWIIVAAAVVLGASTISRGRRPRGWVLVTGAGLGLIADGQFGFPVSPVMDWARITEPGLFGILVPAVLAVAGLLRLEPEIRRRVIACAVPVLAAFPLVQGFSGFEQHNQWHPEALRLINPGQWAVLVAVPALAFWVAAWLNVRLERTRAAVSTGRAQDM